MGKDVSPLGRNLGVQNIVMEMPQYEGKWLQHCEREREDTDRIPKRALKGKQKREKKHGTSEEKMVG